MTACTAKRSDVSASQFALNCPVVTSTHGPKLNHLIAALPAPLLKRWLPRLELIDLPNGHVLYESREATDHVYFPTTAIVSLRYVMENDKSAEIAIVGKEGLVGISTFMGGSSTPSRAVVQVGGRGYRLNAKIAKEEFDQSGPAKYLILNYAQVLITQISITAACNRYHSLDRQFCRWLLLNLDRLPGNQLAMTQELIAHNLGVRRSGVCKAALEMQKAGLISYRRGHIKVLDRTALEHRSCGCYAALNNEFNRLLPIQMKS